MLSFECALLIGMRIIELRNGLETLSGFRSGKNRGISHLRPRYANIKELSHCRFQFFCRSLNLFCFSFLLFSDSVRLGIILTLRYRQTVGIKHYENPRYSMEAGHEGASTRNM